MLEVKEFMCSPDLSQPIQVAVRAEQILSSISPAVLPRSAIPKKQLDGLRRFVALMCVHHSDREPAMQYLHEWMGRTSASGLTPMTDLRFWDQERKFDELPSKRKAVSDPFALHHSYTVKKVTVALRKAGAGKRPCVADGLPTDFIKYLQERVSQGASKEDAQEEWNGMVMLREV